MNKDGKPMTTITKERIELFIKNPLENGLTRGEQMELARIAMASLEAKPVRYLNKFSGVCVTLEQQPNAADDVAVYMLLYAAPPVQETGIYKDMLNIISLLEKNEWAEHCTSTVLGSLLESEITRLVSKEQPTPIVPESISVRQAISALESADSVTTIGQAYKMGWNACRAAMLQGVEQPQNARQNIPENIPDGNSPAIPDDWVMVPKKLTAENGAKSLLSGEFLETTFISCPECFADEECESCDGSGRIKIEVPVSWTTIKAIWNKGVEHFRSSTATGDN
ncbi:putative bacteriophage protein [Salmonella enterica subsp. enterica serovar Cubana str. CFSAN001083]|nr:Eaa protein [Salmonella enterica subsp. enterica serovar Cubana str. CFSAN002050]ESJ36733.1 putative bacteriophage protein [Salmonella enterica subsp. enterica serovar Cubana str. CFSAN001083]ESV53286.1 Eaa protein [Salmonella enterica subsp. enterica serovar Cubana str. CVM42234]PQB13859.1 Phage EaA protein [Salmonella enterica subsp. enterica serovar Cubana]SUF11295.1 Eaa protein [Salmonella enterica]